MKSVKYLLIAFHLIILLTLLKAQENPEKKAVTTTNHSHHHHNHRIHVYRHKGNFSSTGIWCYTCMSGPLSNMSRAIFMRSLQIPAEAESNFCNDPFHNISTTTELHNASNPRSLTQSIWGMDDTSINKRRGLGILVQSCESSCIKAVLKSQNANIIFRGCLTSVYQQISARDYSFSMPPVGSCDEQEHSSKGITVTTETCLCSTDFCNGGISSYFYSVYINIFYYCILYIIICVFFK